jgi:mRNA interferase RelE/StbE
MAMVTIRLSAELKNRIDTLSAQSGRPMSYFVRELIERGIEEFEEDLRAQEVIRELPRNRRENNLDSPKRKWEPTVGSEKQLSRLPKAVSKRVLKKLNELVESDNPVKRLKRLRGVWSPFYSYRVGDYRLIIDVEDEVLTLILIDVDHRKDIYNN